MLVFSQMESAVKKKGETREAAAPNTHNTWTGTYALVLYTGHTPIHTHEDVPTHLDPRCLSLTHSTSSPLTSHTSTRHTSSPRLLRRLSSPPHSLSPFFLSPLQPHAGRGVGGTYTRTQRREHVNFWIVSVLDDSPKYFDPICQLSEINCSKSIYSICFC